MHNVKFKFILADCCNKKLIDEIFKKYNINFVIHCAAYKHVPLIELNPIVGLTNNIISTKIFVMFP